MKVRCVIDDDETDLLYGEVYDVISIERDWYRIIDRSGEDYMYSPKAFEIVDPLPAPPVLTEEDVRQGKGGMYVAVNEYDYNEDAELAVAEPMAVYGEVHPTPKK